MDKDTKARQSQLSRVTRRALLQSAAFAGVAASLPRFARASIEPIVEVASGKLRGAVGSVLSFKGVPYGSSTAGERRFKPPRPVAAWTGVRDALAYGHAAPQGNSLAAPPPTRPGGISLVGEGATFSEDCLYLNVWTPAADSAKRPVLVWLHGGGFATGSGGSVLYDGTNMARTQDVVVVTINHRLNVFGHLDLSRIAGAEYADSANVGM